MDELAVTDNRDKWDGDGSWDENGRASLVDII